MKVVLWIFGSLVGLFLLIGAMSASQQASPAFSPVTFGPLTAKNAIESAVYTCAKRAGVDPNGAVRMHHLYTMDACLQTAIPGYTEKDGPTPPMPQQYAPEPPKSTAVVVYDPATDPEAKRPQSPVSAKKKPSPKPRHHAKKGQRS